MHDKCLIKTKRALNLWVEDTNRKHAPTDSNVLHQKALSLYEDSLQQGHVREGKNIVHTGLSTLRGFRHAHRGSWNIQAMDKWYPVQVNKCMCSEKICNLKNICNVYAVFITIYYYKTHLNNLNQ